jgi:hypothetical protein
MRSQRRHVALKPSELKRLRQSHSSRWSLVGSDGEDALVAGSRADGGLPRSTLMFQP